MMWPANIYKCIPVFLNISEFSDMHERKGPTSDAQGCTLLPENALAHHCFTLNKRFSVGILHSVKPEFSFQYCKLFLHKK